MSELTLDVELRESGSKNVVRRLRADGKVPAVVYGGDAATVPIQIDRKQIVSILRGGGDNPVFLLKVPGTSESRHTMIKEMQVDPIERRILHVDFQRIEMSETVRVKVVVELIGEPLGVKNDGGIVDFVTREVEVECLPASIPSSLELDISELHIGQHLEAAIIPLPDGVELVEDGERVIMSVAAPRAEEEEVEEEEDLLEGDADEPELVADGKEGEDAEGKEDAD